METMCGGAYLLVAFGGEVMPAMPFAELHIIYSAGWWAVGSHSCPGDAVIGDVPFNCERHIPVRGLLAWRAASDLTLAQDADVSLIPDRTDHGRDLTCGGNRPIFEEDVANGQPGVSFDGTNDPLINADDTIIAKHIFVVAAYADASFPSGEPGYAGLFSGLDLSSPGILIGNASSSKFYDFDYEMAGTFKYRRRDRSFAENNMQASFSGGLSIFEVSFSTGWVLAGHQIGKDRNFAGRLWKGLFCEDLVYGVELNDYERMAVYEYLALKYWIWREASSGLDVWPFAPNWARPLALNKRVLSSTSVGGGYKARVKLAAKKGTDLRFETRCQDEYDAAVAFWDAHHPGTPFIYRDDAFYPSRDTTMRFTSDLPQQANGFHDIDYNCQAEQV